MNKPNHADRDFGSTDCSSSSPLEVLIDTGGDDVHHPYTAFNQGFAAFNQGYPDEANPYTKNSENQRFSEAMWWSLGWVEAMEQEDKDFGSDSASVSDPFYHTDFTTAPHPVFNVEAFLKRATATVEECYQNQLRKLHKVKTPVLDADKSSKGGSRELVVDPDIIADFTNLPFADNTFALVVFDPPHFGRNGQTGWIAKKYGTLGENWKEEIAAGFRECFRVLRPLGTLVFKWNEDEVSVGDILKLTPEKPLFGNKYGKHYKSHWIVFLKGE